MTARRLGRRMKLSLADNVQRTLYLTGTYEAPVLTWLDAQLRPGDTYIDVGGHIGIHALVAARRLAQIGGEVLVFEPAPDAASAIRETTRDLPVKVIEVALGHRTGHMGLRADPAFGERDASTRSFFNEGEVAFVVPVKRFDDVATNRMDIVKIDVEGSEYDVLLGMGRSIAAHRPRALLVELQARRLEQAGQTEEAVTSLLRSYGYALRERLPGDNAVYCPAT